MHRCNDFALLGQASVGSADSPCRIRCAAAHASARMKSAAPQKWRAGSAAPEVFAAGVQRSRLSAQPVL
eukprot:5418803-Pleurochrysis_carterae.AAC.4